MHYKNGREAKNGDKVLLLPSYGAPMVGILYDAVAGNDSCNGKLAACGMNDPIANLAACLHVEDVISADKQRFIVDSTLPATGLPVTPPPGGWPPTESPQSKTNT